MSDTLLDDLANNPGAGGIIEDPLDYIDFAAKYHGDAAFRETVDADPAAALRSEGQTIADDVQVRLLTSDQHVIHIVLPAPDAGTTG